MNDTTFVIDETKLDGLLKRLHYNAFKNIVIIGIAVFISQYFSYGSRNIKLLILSFCITTPFLLLIVFFSTKRKFRKTYETLKIVLNENGVELKAEGAPYKNIAWGNMIVKEQKTGVIDLLDNALSNFSRRWSGIGWIRIQPEIADRDNLLIELKKRAAQVI